MWAGAGGVRSIVCNPWKNPLVVVVVEPLLPVLALDLGSGE